jgi:hypothetical protein
MHLIYTLTSPSRVSTTDTSANNVPLAIFDAPTNSSFRRGVKDRYRPRAVAIVNLTIRHEVKCVRVCEYGWRGGKAEEEDSK